MEGSPRQAAEAEVSLNDRPRPGDWTYTPRQRAFLASGAFEALYGGAAGGGKSDALLVAPLRWTHLPSFKGIIFRRTYADLEKELIGRSSNYYKTCEPRAEYNDQKKRWRFPSGAEIRFGHLEHEKDKYDHQGAEYQFIGFDELTHFTETQYTYLLSRARSSKGVPIRIRSATNPGGVGHEWVMRRWAPWLDPTTMVKAKPDEALWYANTNDGAKWVERGTPDAFSRVFFPATLADNPHVGGLTGQYANQLRGMDAVTRAQLLDGNWLVKPAAGMYFKRAWLEVVPMTPPGVERARWWDRAASVDGDWTAGVRLARDPRDGIFYVEDVVRMRGRPAEVMATIKQTAAIDPAGTEIAITQDPGSAGVEAADAYIRELAGFNVRKHRETGDKITRAQPASAQAEGRRVRIVKGAWNADFLAEIEAFPEGDHDDQVDAFSGALSILAGSLAPVVGDIDALRAGVSKFNRWPMGKSERSQIGGDWDD